MTLHTTIQTDAAAVFTQTSDFAEAVTYKPHQYFGEATPTNRSINAVVMRQQIEVVSEAGDHTAVVYLVHVNNSSTTGISSDELDLGGDVLSFPPRDGEAAAYHTIVRLVTQDWGMLVLECRGTGETDTSTAAGGIGAMVIGTSFTVG